MSFTRDEIEQQETEWQRVIRRCTLPLYVGEECLYHSNMVRRGTVLKLTPTRARIEFVKADGFHRDESWGYRSDTPKWAQNRGAFPPSNVAVSLNCITKREPALRLFVRDTKPL
jgi:hypothetical protein